MLYGLDAMAHGALVALLVAPVALLGFWRLAAGLRRGARLGLSLAAAYGAASLAGGAWALLFERTAWEDEALFGTLLAALALLLLAIPLLLIFTPRS